MRVTKLMSKQIITINMDDPLSTVKDIFERQEFHHLLVVADDKLLGVISDRDLFKSLNPKIDSMAATTKDLACLNIKVHQIMTREPIYLSDEATVKSAIEMFNQHKISCIPIINNEGKPVGILSWRDIMKALIKSK